MLSPPIEIADESIVSAVLRGWGMRVVSMDYRPVGFGSHHWQVGDAAGVRWFATVDDLATKRHSSSEPFDTAFDRLRAALSAATDLRACGRTFVVAPIPTLSGQPLARLADRFGLAVYPFVDGRSFAWCEWGAPAHRSSVLALLVATHCAPSTASRRAMTDGFSIPHRDQLELALDGCDDAPDRGPYGRATSQLMRENAAPIRRLLHRYDELVTDSRAGPSRTVLTHGEPHPGNTMLTSDGLLLIDWDTALLAPPERDLWSLDPGDASILDTYAEATGVQPHQPMLELYRIRWDLADIAVDVDRFRSAHTGSLDDTQSWELLRSLVAHIGRR